MGKRFIEYLIRNEMIMNEEYELYQYGLSILNKKIVHTCIFLIIAFICNQLRSTLVFVVVYASIREYSGGYHAKTTKGCYLCTIVVSICLICLLNTFQMLRFWNIELAMLISGCIIWLLSPQESDNNPLDESEINYCRKTTHNYLIGFGCFSLLGFYWSFIMSGISCAWTIQAVMLLIRKTQRCNEKNKD